MKRFMICIALATLAGCASTPVPTDQATPVAADRVFAPTGMLNPCGHCGTLIVKRDAHTTMAAGSSEHAYLDGKLIANMWPGEKITLYLPPGHYVLSATFVAWAGEPTQGFDMHKGERLIFRLAQGGMSNSAPEILESSD